jgi:hypothetical protein
VTAFLISIFNTTHICSGDVESLFIEKIGQGVFNVTRMTVCREKVEWAWAAFTQISGEAKSIGIVGNLSGL